MQARDPCRVDEQSLAASQHHWIGEQSVFVDESGGDELPDQRDAARGHDVPAGLCLQPSDVLDAAQYGGVLPLGVLQRA